MVTKTTIIFGLVCSIINGGHIMIPNLSFYNQGRLASRKKQHVNEKIIAKPAFN